MDSLVSVGGRNIAGIAYPDVPQGPHFHRRGTSDYFACRVSGALHVRQRQGCKLKSPARGHIGRALSPLLAALAGMRVVTSAAETAGGHCRRSSSFSFCRRDGRLAAAAQLAWSMVACFCTCANRAAASSLFQGRRVSGLNAPCATKLSSERR